MAMSARDMKPRGRGRVLASSLLVGLVLLTFCELPAAAVEAAATSSTRSLVRVAPSGGDDTQSLQAALDAASAAGPGAVIHLTRGVFRVGRPLVGLNLDVTIRGAGMGRTQIVADGGVNPDGLFQLLPAGEAAALRSLATAYLFLFVESDVDRFGEPVGTRRSQRVAMRDLTLGSRGRTVAHFDPNEDFDTQRLFSLVWVEGYRPDWTNSQEQTPGDIGRIDVEHAQVSTVRASFGQVHFDGRNRARGDDEPGGPLDPAPDVRNGFGLEGGFFLFEPAAEPPFLFKPVNAALRFDRSRFSDLPGQSGIFAPELVGPDDPAWTFGPDAVQARVVVKDSVFHATPEGVLIPDISDVEVAVTGSRFRQVDLGVDVITSGQSTQGQMIAYPASVPSQVTVRGSRFVDTAVAAVWVEELGPSLIDLKVVDNSLVLAASSQAGIVGFNVEDARVRHNEVAGEGYAGVVAKDSAHWRIHHNDFCDLVVPPGATADPDLELPANQAGVAVVLLDSVDIQLTHNRCA
jgi:hypothetical protein